MRIILVSSGTHTENFAPFPIAYNLVWKKDLEHEKHK
jgi:hypothetical protein